MRAELTIS
jgi:hypothetical protein